MTFLSTITLPLVLALFHFVGPVPTDLGIQAGHLSPCPGPAHCASAIWPVNDAETSLATLAEAIEADPSATIVEREGLRRGMRGLVAIDVELGFPRFEKLEARLLEENGLAQNTEGRLELTPRALRAIGQNALGDLFNKLMDDKIGSHRINRTGVGHERAYETKPYEFGDNLNLNIEQTVRNAISRNGQGTPVGLTPDDFEIERTEMTTRASTVLMLDLSLSMPMRDNFLPAKKVTMALHSLISSQYPRDYLGLVGFAESAFEFNAPQLPEVSWDYAYGTNMQHGFMIARRLLARQSGTKQIIRSGGCQQDQVKAVGRPAGHGQSRSPRFSREVIQALVGAAHATCGNPGAAADPLIAGVNTLPQLVVTDHLGCLGAAAADQSYASGVR